MARRDVIRGGPGQDREPEPEPEDQEQPQPTRRPRPEPEPEPEPVVTRRTIELGGKRVEVDNDVAEALDAYRAESDARIQQQARAIEELYGRVPKPPEPKETPVNFDTLLFEKPSEALRLHGERIKQELQSQYAEDQAARQQVQVMEKFWSDFYGDHPELREDDLLVRSIFGSNVNAFLDMTPAKAREELAGAAKTTLGKIAARYGAPEGGTPVRVEEGSKTRRGPVAPRPESQGPRSLSEALRLRREAKTRPIRREREAG